jgi:predicted dienelactone hydrolase
MRQALVALAAAARAVGFSLPAFAATLLVPSPARAADAPAPATFHCGLRELTYKDPSTGTATQLTVYYPTPGGEQSLRRDLYTLSVAPDAPPIDGKLPLILWSHGSGGTTLGHHDSAEWLARRGFIVVAPLHAGNNHFDHAAEGTARMWQGRPRALTAALDAVIADGKLGPHVDVARIGAAGFSAGGYTVLVAAGAIADIGLLVKHCATHAAEDQEFCSYSHGQPAPDVGKLEPLRLQDKRIRALVAMAPVGVLFGSDAMAGITVPVRLYRPEKDVVLRQPFHAEHVHQLLPKAEYVVVPNAGHYAFLTPFPTGLGPGVGPIAEDPPGFDRAAFHGKLNAELTQFFQRTLAPANTP